MSIRLTRLMTTISLSAISTLFVTFGAKAQIAPTDSQLFSPENPAEVFDRAFGFGAFSGDFFENRTIESQIGYILGPGPINRSSYLENEITRQAFLIDLLYRDLLENQVSSDPVIRTPDLANPFATSLYLNPSYRALPAGFFQPTPPFPGTEFRFDRLPAE